MLFMKPKLLRIVGCFHNRKKGISLIAIIKYKVVLNLTEQWENISTAIPGCVVQSVTSLTANTCLTADPGVTISIPARTHTFMEIDHEILSKVITSLRLFQEGLLSVTSESMSTKYWLTSKSSLPRKKCG